MNALLVAINAKYPHTNPAVRSIAAFAREVGAGEVPFVEFTVNQRANYILAELYAKNSAVYMFSCYIWNIALVQALARELRKIRPTSRIWAGGPEVSWRSGNFLRQNPAFDLVIRGEGEETTALLLRAAKDNSILAAVPGITFRQEDGGVLETPPAPPPDMDTLPFPYRDLEELAGRVIYYESMRGCPFACAYCISSLEKGVRFRSLELVYSDLQRLLDAGIPRVKFVDRTFNCNKNHAMSIWRFLKQRDNGVINFHFELAGELLDDEMADFLATLRPGLFQFEIGVQSTNEKTLQEISRPARLDRLFQMVGRISQPGNIHLHLDLIAGLPYEDEASFQASFNQVYGLRPAQLQLGFLKVLRGSGIEQNAARYGLLFRDAAPYEVLATHWMDYGTLEQLKGTEEMLELYYNSGRFAFLIQELCARFPTPFAFYAALAECWAAMGHRLTPPGKTGQYQFLYAFMRWKEIPVTPREKWLCKYDLALHEKLHKLPAWVDVDLTAPHRKAVADFYRNGALMRRYLPHLEKNGPRQAAKLTQIERFPFHPATREEGPVFLLFDYSRRDILGRAQVQSLSDSIFAL